MTTDRRNVPITIRGVTYPSHRAAAEALGVTWAAISQAKKRGYLDKVGLGDGNKVPTTVDGVTYPSREEASRQTGVPVWALRPQKWETAE